MLLVAALAAWLGAWEERTVGFGMVVAWVAVGLFHNSPDWREVQLGELIAGIIYLAVLLWVALRSDRWWPLWTAAFQVVSVPIFLARMADPRIGAWASMIWSYLILFVVAVGTWRRWRDRVAESTARSPAGDGSAMQGRS